MHFKSVSRFRRSKTVQIVNEAHLIYSHHTNAAITKDDLV